MPSFDTDTQDKIVILRGLYNLGTTIEICELLRVGWSVDETVWYSVLDPSQMSVVPVDEDDNPIVPEVRLIPGGDPNWFLPIKTDSTVGDAEVDLEFWDGDGDISDRLVEFGEGGNVTAYLWFPQVELLLRFWPGHLETGDGGDGVTVKIKAAQGFRAVQEDLPSRAHVTYCQAIFGGLFASQAEINDHDCPYNLHVGGSIGIVNPDTGLPWTFCDRRDIQSCIDRGVYQNSESNKTWYHLSHRTIQVIAENNQTKGPRLYETSHGNESNLSEPVRVVMGERRFYDMSVMAFTREHDTRNPQDGFFRALYEGPEGPMEGFNSTVVQAGDVTQAVIGLHFAERHGEIGQADLVPSLTTHSYSGTSLIAYATQVDPDTVDEGQAKANSLVRGLRNIRVYYDAGNGLVGEYFRLNNFDERLGRRIDPTIDFSSTSSPPIQALFSENGFCAEWPEELNFITPRYSETYTFTTIQDDVVSVWINGTLVINEATWPATGSGTIALTADVPVSIRIKYKQLANVGFNPWSLTLKWQSASQALEVVPNSRLSHVATYTLEYSRNRVWHIARMLCDKRWGAGWDYEDLNIELWKEAAEWVDETVAFTDPFGAVWYHTRGLSDVELVGRKTQQQIEDMCIAGRLSLPFLFDGKVCIIPLRALTEDELADAPVFTEAYGNNIIWENNQSTLKIGPQKSAFDLPNQIKVSIDDVTQNYVDTPLRPFEDTGAQLAAGRARGGTSRKINKKEYKLLGVTVEAQATKLGWSLLDVGELDRGGLQNNLPITFKIWFAEALDLHPWKVIKVVSDRLTRYGFQYFRVLEMDRADDLTYTLTCQAYNETYMASFEDTIDIGDIPPDPPGPVPFPDPPGPEPLPREPIFNDITFNDNVLSILVI